MRGYDVQMSIRKWLNGLWPDRDIYLERPVVKNDKPRRPYLVLLPGLMDSRAYSRFSTYLLSSHIITYCAASQDEARAAWDTVFRRYVDKAMIWGYLVDYAFDGWLAAEAAIDGTVPAGVYFLRATARNAIGESLLPGEAVQVTLEEPGRILCKVGWPATAPEIAAEYVVYMLVDGIWREALVIPRPVAGVAQGFIVSLPGGTLAAPTASWVRFHAMRIVGLDGEVMQSLEREDWWDAVMRIRLEAMIRRTAVQTRDVIEGITLSGKEVS